MFSDLELMSFPERVIYMKAIQMLKIIRGDAPEYLRSLFTFGYVYTFNDVWRFYDAVIE